MPNSEILIIFAVLGFLYALSLDDPAEENAIVGRNKSIFCQATDERVWWTKNGNNITKENKRFTWNTSINEPYDNEIDLTKEVGERKAKPTYSHTLTILNVELTDSGNYSCHFPSENENITETSFFVQSVMLPKIVSSSAELIKIKNETVVLFCVVEAYPMNIFKHSIAWEKETVDTVDNKDSTDASQINAVISNHTKIVQLNETRVNVTISFKDVNKKHNGTYKCSISQPSFLEEDIGKVQVKSSILVLGVPLAMISYVKAVGATKIFMNWTINDGNDPIDLFYIQFQKENQSTFSYYFDRISGKNTSYVLEKFEPNTKYQLKLQAQNSQGLGPVTTSDWVTTLSKDPVFVPKIEVKGNSHSTITIGWTPPSADLLDYIHYYELICTADNNKTLVETTIHPQNSRNLPYMFDNLKTATEYLFQVRACSELTKACGNWSEIVNGTTMDGSASEPINVKITCTHFNFSRRNQVAVEWSPPTNPNGKIVSYQVVLDGISTFRTEQGTFKNETYGPKIKSINENFLKTMYENVPPNTNYTVRVAALTRSKRPGDISSVSCKMPPTVPDQVGRFLWGKIQDDFNHWVFKLFLPRISERNGPICCYRIYMIRMGKDSNDFEQTPDDYDVETFEEVHAANNTKGGAYLAQIIPNNAKFHSEVYLGDGVKNQYSRSSFEGNDKCNVCLKNTQIKRQRRKKPSTTTAAFSLLDDERLDEDPVTIASVAPKKTIRRRRHPSTTEFEATAGVPSLSIYDSVSLNLSNKNKSVDTLDIYDGILDINSNYSGFIEVVVQSKDNDDENVVSTYSEYFQVMSPKAPLILETEQDNSARIFNIITHFLAALILVVLFLFFILCLLHRYQKKNVAQGNEVVSLTDSLRALCHGRGNHHPHRTLVGAATKPPDLAPIQRDALPQAYIDRHKDSDYGFQHEFEQLPDRFSDRTTKNSDSKDNSFKNRYPDIKSYDQTRVKLNTVNSVIGSDYINANFVIGYKERKKFICAQGPMDSTINEFWRMIWEQHLEIIVMLTNLEEYNKTKCAKYWPERVTESIQFGDINVLFESEQRYSDYLVRNIKITKRQGNNEEDEELVEEPARFITQYHYLVWKDFMAPEHPHGIIKFIRTINADYSVQRGPLLIHCSAGVGRTGTLVALDSMIQQLNEEGQVTIFNTVCDMRHQRNYLVQSLKQYIFLYRALLDVAQFGDTELKYKGLSAAVEQLKKPDTKDKCKLEKEYERIKTVQDDIKRTSVVGNNEENRQKNRSEEVIPYDRNRVILTPIPGRDHSTYINASFIEGYDNHESFIIAQDPLEGTIGDFWRMISEQSITTVVMMSEIGDISNNKCPRYWADDEVQYDHILVKYVQSETCPYYTKREFVVTNCKMDDQTNVTAFQYQGWPTESGTVPEVTRGLLEIVHQAQKYHDSLEDGDQIKPIVVHCCNGTDRSSIFVAISILVQQLRLEKRVDVCTTVRKLRSQRPQMIDSYAQYELIHRAIVNYGDLHKQSLDSPQNS